jgi:hypothetical protein
MMQESLDQVVAFGRRCGIPVHGQVRTDHNQQWIAEDRSRKGGWRRGRRRFRICSAGECIRGGGKQRLAIVDVERRLFEHAHVHFVEHCVESVVAMTQLLGPIRAAPRSRADKQKDTHWTIPDRLRRQEREHQFELVEACFGVIDDHQPWGLCAY